MTFLGWTRSSLCLLMMVVMAGCGMDSFDVPGFAAEGRADEETTSEPDTSTSESADEQAHALMTRMETRSPVLHGEDDRTVAERVQDATLATRVKQALAGRRTLQLYDFDTEVHRGVVLLEGTVATETERDLALRVAGEVNGVEEVVPHLIAEEPSSPSGEEQTAEAHHVVQPGESLWQIARSHNMRVDIIKELNGMTSNSLRPGQRLRVR